MSTIRQVESEDDIDIVQDLFWEYLQWANVSNYQEFGIKLDIATMLEDDMCKLEIFSPPNGRVWWKNLIQMDYAASR